MNHEHTAQCEHIEHNFGEQITLLSGKIDYNNKITENLTQQFSGMASDIKAIDKKVNDNHEEMKPWLEAKIGLNLLWRWAITIPIIVAVLIGIKTLLGWLGWHK